MVIGKNRFLQKSSELSESVFKIGELVFFTHGQVDRLWDYTGYVVVGTWTGSF